MTNNYKQYIFDSQNIRPADLVKLKYLTGKTNILGLIYVTVFEVKYSLVIMFVVFKLLLYRKYQDLFLL